MLETIKWLIKKALMLLGSTAGESRHANSRHIVSSTLPLLISAAAAIYMPDS